jgi:hypothetical protein
LKLFIVSVHSAVDVITNSSSELFICEGDAAARVIEDSLMELLRKYNEENNTHYTFTSVFTRPVTATRKVLKEIEEHCCWGFTNHRAKSLTGKVVFCSAQENSVPYELMLEIESKLNVKREHLG